MVPLGMEQRYSTKEISKIVNVYHRSIKNLIRCHVDNIKIIGELKSGTEKTESGQNETCYYLTKKQLSYVTSNMKRKANVSKIIKKYDLDCFYISGRLENTMFEIVEKIVSSFDNDLIVVQDYTVGRRRVDMAIFTPSIEIKNLWAIIEYDEPSHKYNSESDINREREIIEDLNGIDPNFESIYIIRIKQGEEYEGIGYIIRFLNSGVIQLGSSCESPIEKFKVSYE